MGKRKWLEPEHTDLLRRLRGEKVKIRIIAKTMGFSKQTICTKMRNEGLTHPSNAGRPSGIDKELIPRNQSIISDCENGMTVYQAANKYGLSYERIRQIITKNQGINGKV